jgi:nucleotide-binding universal stress UspA family protein
LATFAKILLAVDGSEESRKSASTARALASELGSELIVVHVKEVHYSGAAAWSPEPSPELEALIHEVVEGMKSEGLEARRVLEEAPHGHVGKAIADIAAQSHADVIVMGSTGHSQLAGLLLGSVATRALHFAQCPVLIVKGTDVAARERSGELPS